MVLQHNRILANGLRLVLLPMPQLHGTSITYAVRCGSGQDPQKHWGLGHLLEHMMFRGSREHRSIASLMQVFEQAGGSLDAGTWRDHTHYGLTVHPSALQSVLRALGGMLAAPRLADLAIERAIVIEEIKADLDETGQDTDLTNLSRACLWGGDKMGRRVTGSVQSVSRLGRPELQAHHRLYYGAHNGVLCLAGAFDLDQAADWAAQSFGALRPGQRASEPVPLRRSGASCQACCQDYEAAQVSLQLSYPAMADSDADFLAARLLSNILDDGLTTRLPQALSDRRGLVYDLSSGLDCYANVGLYDIEMHLDPAHVQEALRVVGTTLTQLCRSGVRQEELLQARRRWLHQIDFRQDDGETMAQQAAAAALFGRQELQPTCWPLQEEASALEKINLADLQRVARRLFAGVRPHLTAVGPVGQAGLLGQGKKSWACAA